MSESAYHLAKRLAAKSVVIDTETRSVRLDDDTKLTKRTYLRIRGTPEGFRWLSELLMERTKGSNGSVIVSDHDFDPISLTGFDAIDVSCETDLSTKLDDAE